MNQSNFLTVSQVVDQLKSNYQKVLYMIRTNKIPAKKEGRAFKIPVNYQELMAEKAEVPRKKRATRRGVRASFKEPEKKKEAQAVSQELLVQNLVRAIQGLVEYQVEEVLGKKKAGGKK